MRQLRLFGDHFNNLIKQFIVLVLVLLSVQVPDVLAQYVSAEPEIFLQSVEKKEAEAQSVFQARLKLAGKSSISVTSILLDPLSEQEQETIRSAIVRQDTTKKRKVGIGRSVPSPYCDAIDPGLFHWTGLPEGGRVAVFSVKSPEAAALRVEIKVIHMPKGTELRFYNPTNPEEVYGPYLIDQIRGQMVDDSFWSPVIEGDSIAIEIFLPKGLDCDDFSIAIPQISHLWSSVLNSCGEKRLSEIGASGYCNIDIACTDWDGSYAERSVAKMVFTEGLYTYACTGTVLNDLDPTTQIPYFMTSRHCISTQAAASSLSTYWNFQKSSYYGPNPSTVTQLTGGAKLLSTGSSTDYTLLRLYQNLPSGTGLAGWTTAPVDYGSEVVGIHHPRGDLKKISFGTAQGFRYCTSGDQFTCYPGNGGYIAIGWYSGVTESGSSGSALFDDQGHVIGTLRGGASSCQEPCLLDTYGRFDLTYPLVKQWLGEITTPSHVFARDDSGHLREWWWGPDTGWHLEDLSAAVGGQLISGDPSYFNDGYYQHVFARDDSGHLREWWWGPGTGWHLEDLSAAVGGQLISGDPSYFNDGYYQHVFARDDSGHLREWWWGPDTGWHLEDLSAAVGGQLISGDPEYFNDGYYQHVFARDDSGHLREWWWGPDTGWHLEDLSAAVGGQLISGDPAYFNDGYYQHVFARDDSGHLREWWWEPDTGWHLEDLSAAVGGQLISGDPAYFNDGYYQHVFARDDSGHLREWWWESDTGWHLEDLSAAVGGQLISGDPEYFNDGYYQHVFARDDSGHLREWWWESDTGWHLEDLSAAVGGQLISGDPDSGN